MSLGLLTSLQVCAGDHLGNTNKEGRAESWGQMGPSDTIKPHQYIYGLSSHTGMKLQFLRSFDLAF